MYTLHEVNTKLTSNHLSKAIANSTPKKGNVTRSETSLKEKDKSSDEASFTLVSYQRKAVAREE